MGQKKERDDVLKAKKVEARGKLEKVYTDAKKAYDDYVAGPKKAWDEKLVTLQAAYDNESDSGKKATAKTALDTHKGADKTTMENGLTPLKNKFDTEKGKWDTE